MPHQALHNVEPIKLLELEKRAALYLKNHRKFQDEKFHEFNQLVETWLQTIEYILDNHRGKRKGKHPIAYQYELKIPVLLEGTECYAYCGFKLEYSKGKYSEFNSRLAIVQQSNKELRRNFHVDAVCNPALIKFPHPYIHIQNGGLILGLLKQEVDKSQVIANEKVSSFGQPRLPFYLLPLGLLVNLVFLECENNDFDEIVSEGTWRNLIRDYEVQILLPCFTNICGYLGRLASTACKDPLMIKGFYANGK